jgi:hypothetical protein
MPIARGLIGGSMAKGMGAITRAQLEAMQAQRQQQDMLRDQQSWASQPTGDPTGGQKTGFDFSALMNSSPQAPQQPATGGLIGSAMPKPPGYAGAPAWQNRAMPMQSESTPQPPMQAPQQQTPPGLIGGAMPKKQGNGILGPLGYDREATGVGPLKWMFSSREEMDAARANVSMQKQIDGMNLSPADQMWLRADPEGYFKAMNEKNAPQDLMNIPGNGAVFDPKTRLPIFQNTTPKEEKPQDIPPGMMFDEQGKPQWIPGYKEGYREMHPQSAGRGGGELTPYQQWQVERGDKLDAQKTGDRDKARSANVLKLQDGVKLVDQFVDSKGFKHLYGWREGRAPDWMMDQPTLDANALLEQISGQAFLTGVESMRGTGPLSDREGSNVVRAVTRLTNRTQSDESAAQAAQEFKASMQRLLDAYEKEGQQSDPTDSFIDGLFDGGDAGGLNPDEQAELEQLRMELGR